MASNPYVNKVDLANGTTLIDLSQDTATQADVAQGKYFHLPTGERVQGTASGGGGGSLTQDQDGYLVVPTTGGGGGGGGGLEYEEGTWTPASDTSSFPATRISFSNSHTTAPFFAVIEDVTDTLAPADSMLWWTEINIGNLYGAVATTSSALLYGRRQYANKTSSSYSAGGANLTSQADIDLDTTGFDLTAGSATYYWRAGRTYKWIAVWAPTT